jgi:glycerophosphoryl diester phosphodiesterase
MASPVAHDRGQPPVTVSSSAAGLLSLTRRCAIAHRGGSRLRPENTLLAFEHAAALGVDAIECDVHLSRDGEPVVIHDPTLDRTTDATGLVAARSADELSRIDAGCRFLDGAAHPYRGLTGVPRLSDVLARTPGLPIIVEIKGDEPETADRTMAVIRAMRAEARVIIGGFGQRVLDAVRLGAPAIPTSASRIEALAALRRSYLLLPPRAPRYRVFQVPLRLRGKRVLTRLFVRLARRAQLPVHVWVIDDPAEMRLLLHWGATGIISDRPDLALAVVRQAS